MSIDQESFICKICNSTLSSQGNLVRHKITNKKCLKLQGKEPIKTFDCGYCVFKSTYNSALVAHEKKCKFKIKSDEDELLALKIKCAVQEKEIEIYKKYKNTPTNINNINNINLTITQKIEFSKSILSPYCDILNNLQHIVNTYIEPEKFIKHGYKHIIDVIINKILKHNNNQYYISIDPKDSFYRLIDDKLDTDDKANKLIDEIYPFIRKKCNILKQVYQLSLDEDKLTTEEIEKEQQRTNRLYDEITEIYNTDSLIRKKLIKNIISRFNVSKESLNMLCAQEDDKIVLL